MIDKKIEIGLRFKEFVQKNFSSLAEFARQMDRHVTYFSPYYAGKNVLGGEMLSQLGDIGCDLNWLLTGHKFMDKELSDELEKMRNEFKTENDKLKIRLFDLEESKKELEKLKIDFNSLREDLFVLAQNDKKLAALMVSHNLLSQGALGDNTG